MVPYNPNNPFAPTTPMYSGPGPDPLQAALTSANQMTGQLAPTQPSAGPYGPANPPYTQQHHDIWNAKLDEQRMRALERMMSPYPKGGPISGMGTPNPYPNPPIPDPLPGPGPRFPDVQEQVPRMNERIMREMRENRRPSLPKPSAMPQPPRANPTGAAHKPHQPMQY